MLNLFVYNLFFIMNIELLSKKKQVLHNNIKSGILSVKYIYNRK